ncbi:MAG TPA: sensor domain-containing diguanylate cyclase [Burkholderiales bacterium]|nr:sensor domain-containing diguanylate cyclase [Burkholderiales bacterium]
MATPARWSADLLPDAVMITDADGVIEYVNPAFEALTGRARGEILGRTPAVLGGRMQAGFYRRLWRALRAGRSFRGVFANRRKNGGVFFEEEVIRPVLDASGAVRHFVCSGRDVTRQVRDIDRFKHAATHDALTDLPNRSLFLDRLTQAVRQAARRGESMAVAILDIDGFRDANNRYGHLAGDAVLQAIARRTSGCVRKVDTVARIGGDEFAVVLGNVSRRAAQAVMGKILRANALPVRYARRSVPVSLSIGICMYPRGARTETALRRRADAAMYAAKRAGGNRCRFAPSV